VTGIDSFVSTLEIWWIDAAQSHNNSYQGEIGMTIKSFDEIIEKLKSGEQRARMAVAAAADEHTLEAVFRARGEGLVEPILVGDEARIREIAAAHGYELAPAGAAKDVARGSAAMSATAAASTACGSAVTPLADASSAGSAACALPPVPVIDIPDNAEACRAAVKLVHEGKADLLMKGGTDTRLYLKAVVDRESGLGTGRLMSHVNLVELPGYHKIFALTDMAMVPYPTLDMKKDMLRNAADVLFKLGAGEPAAAALAAGAPDASASAALAADASAPAAPTLKAAILTCVEKVNPKMPETVEAAEIAKWVSEGNLPGVVADGPLSYDIAISREVAEVKGYVSDVAGDADILLGPDIHATNMLGKCLQISAGARGAGFIVGTKCPVVLTSRGATAEEKYLSIVLAAAVS